MKVAIVLLLKVGILAS